MGGLNVNIDLESGSMTFNACSHFLFSFDLPS